MIFDDPRYAAILRGFRAALGARAANLRNDQLERGAGPPAPAKPLLTRAGDVALWERLGVP